MVTPWLSRLDPLVPDEKIQAFSSTTHYSFHKDSSLFENNTIRMQQSHANRENGLNPNLIIWVGFISVNALFVIMG